MRYILTLVCLLLVMGCNKEPKSSDIGVEETAIPIKKTIAEVKKELEQKGFQAFDYVDEKSKDTVLMQ